MIFRSAEIVFECECEHDCSCASRICSAIESLGSFAKPVDTVVIPDVRNPDLSVLLLDPDFNETKR